MEIYTKGYPYYNHNTENINEATGISCSEASDLLNNLIETVDDISHGKPTVSLVAESFEATFNKRQAAVIFALTFTELNNLRVKTNNAPNPLLMMLDVMRKAEAIKRKEKED